MHRNECVAHLDFYVYFFCCLFNSCLLLPTCIARGSPTLTGPAHHHHHRLLHQQQQQQLSNSPSAPTFLFLQPAGGQQGQGQSSPSATEMCSDPPGDRRGTAGGPSCGQPRGGTKRQRAECNLTLSLTPSGDGRERRTTGRVQRGEERKKSYRKQGFKSAFQKWSRSPLCRLGVLSLKKKAKV